MQPSRGLPLSAQANGAIYHTYRSDLSQVRALVLRRAREAGLTESRANDLVLAVSETAANTLRHTRSPGTLVIWYETCWVGLHRRARLQEGETLLVHAAAGGVGTGAIQVGKAAGARVIGVVGGPEKVALAKEVGADVVVDRSAEDFVAVVKEVTGGKGADVVFDPVGGDAFYRSTKCIAFEGRILVVGFASGDIPAAALNHALVKNYDILGLQARTYRFLENQATKDHYAALVKLTETGEVRTVVTERLSLADVPDGLRRLGAGLTTGRIVFIP
jgi:NADPH2:quinone reductase